MLKLTTRNVKVWFQNKRQKENRKARKTLLEKEMQSPLPILDPDEVAEFFERLRNMYYASTHVYHYNCINNQ